MSINTRVWTNAANTESGKFVEIINDSNFPPTSATTDPSFGTPTTVQYPKYAVLTYDVSTGQANGSPFGDNAAIDAFGRLRVAEPKTLLDSKFITSKAPYTFDEVLSGSATSTHVRGDSLIELSTTATNSFAIRQTFTHFNYQPGKSMQILCTGLFQPQTNIIKRIGLFQGLSSIPYLPADGIYLQSANDVVSFHVVKTAGTVSNLSAAQTQWNVDRLDGNGPSGLNIDFSKTQIIAFDYEWLGVGRIRCGFVIGGATYYVHYFDNINALTAPYMSSPNHPIRYEIRQTGAGSGLLKQICSTVMVEGGEENVGITLTTDLSAGISVDTTLRPLLALRLNPSSIDLVALLKNVQLHNEGNTPMYYKVVVNPTITGGSLGTFNAIDGFTDVQVASGSASLSLTGGYDLAGGYVSKGNAAAASGDGGQGIDSELVRLGSKIDGTPIIVVVAGKALVGTANPVYATANLILKA